MKKKKIAQVSDLDRWNRKAQRYFEDLMDFALHFPALRKRVKSGKGRSAHWQAGVRLVGSAEIKKLNSRYRKKTTVTDVLSFSAPEPFRSAGYLGELVIALPVLKRQAKEHHHSSEAELWILLTHGLLHLLGMDHERSERAAKEQTMWEARLLAFTDIPQERSLMRRSKN